jgi:hypothetical protein
MEHTAIKALLEKYWSAETTVEEERLLAAYFRQPVIAPELESCRDLFAWFGEEAALTAGEGLEEKIWEGIRQADNARLDGSGQPKADPGTQAPGPRKAPVRPLYGRTSWMAAAALILLTLGVFLIAPPAKKEGTGSPVARAESPAGNSQKIGILADNIQDTYDDPQQALAAIRKALMTASVKMNRGKNITRQEMHRMNDGWQSAVSN